MDALARENYLTTEVMTATPQKLQLMLIEAAIRTVQRTREAWQNDDHEKACDSLIQAQQILGEMLAALNPEVDADLTGKVASVYLFIFRQLTEASVERSDEKLADAIRILNIERETWQKVCEQLGTRKEHEDQNAVLSISEATETPVAPIKADVAELPAGPVTVEDTYADGFSVDA